jgi:hypothetical protein
MNPRTGRMRRISAILITFAASIFVVPLSIFALTNTEWVLRLTLLTPVSFIVGLIVHKLSDPAYDYTAAPPDTEAAIGPPAVSPPTAK